MSSTAILTDPSYDAHTWQGHVERADRLVAIREALTASGLHQQLHYLQPHPAAEATLLATHTPQLLQLIRQLSSHGGGQFDSDTYVTASSWEVSTLAAGAAIGAVEAVAGVHHRSAFALVRPPGHHSTSGWAMGFCLINNIAVAARYALDRLGLARVAIVDYDVHHGNGTQDIFYAEPRALFCSTHAAPFYPGSGAIDEVGDRVAAPGTTLNVPLPFGVGDAGYARVFAELIAPALRRHRPELILVSAGYDAHWSDPLGPMTLSVGGYAGLTRALVELAAELCDSRIVLVLEGGYNLAALGACVVASLGVLLGQQATPDPLGAVSVQEPDLSNLIRTIQQRHPLLSA